MSQDPSVEEWDLERRQDDDSVDETPDSTSATSQDPSPTLAPLLPAATPIPLGDKIGLIMPDPYGAVYAGLSYSFGFVDPQPKPAPTIGGWLRQVQPLLILPDYDVNIFPSSGQSNVSEEGAVPPGSGGLCGATVINYPNQYPFVFNKTGWYMFVVNQTWIQPTISDHNTCEDPIVNQKSFFAWQSLSVAALPTATPNPPPTTKTIYNPVVTSTPDQLPFEKTDETHTLKLGIGLGVTGAVLLLVGMVTMICWVQRRHKRRRETLAFSRLSEADKAAFLAENPDSWLNPNRRVRQDRGGPPGPPGTLAYKNWYWQQMWNRQYTSHRWGRYRRADPGAMGMGMGVAPQMAMYPGYQNLYGQQFVPNQQAYHM